MDENRFDRLAKTLGSRSPRRRLLGAAAGGSLAAVLGRGARQPATAQESTPAAGHGAPIDTPTAGPLEVRKNGNALSAGEREAFVNAILAIKKKPSPWAPGLTVYDTFVLWHRDAFSCAVMAAHMGPAFLPWHRQFLRMFELELQAVEPTVTLPYWDWTVDREHNSYVWADDFMGGNGDPNQGFAVTTGPFRKDRWVLNVFDYPDPDQYPYLIRQLGDAPFSPTLPTEEDVETALAISTYDAAPWNTMIPTGRSFRNAIEGWQDCVKETCDPVNGMSPTCTGPHKLHNGVHLWIAGEFAFAVEGGREDRRGENLVVVATPTPATDVFGTMAANTSLNDPVFWLHHCNLDRLWSEWMRRHGQIYEPVSGGPLGHNIDDAMWPYNFLGMTITPRMMLTSHNLGYIYDTEV
jgi:tyrosinase